MLKKFDKIKRLSFLQKSMRKEMKCLCVRTLFREVHRCVASFSRDSCKDERDLDKDNGFQRVSRFESRRSGFLTTRPSLLHAQLR